MLDIFTTYLMLDIFNSTTYLMLDIFTTYLMLDIFDNIFESKANSHTPGIIFLDIKKAFDTVDHNILIDKLKFYGAEGTVILWFQNYLKDRYQCTLQYESMRKMRSTFSYV